MGYVKLRNDQATMAMARPATSVGQVSLAKFTFAIPTETYIPMKLHKVMTDANLENAAPIIPNSGVKTKFATRLITVAILMNTNRTFCRFVIIMKRDPGSYKNVNRKAKLRT